MTLIYALLWALLPTFAPTSGVQKESAATTQVIAALEAPQVGFEPTTLRLTEAFRLESPVSLRAVKTAAPVVWGAFGSQGVARSRAESPRPPPRGRIRRGAP